MAVVLARWESFRNQQISHPPEKSASGGTVSLAVMSGHGKDPLTIEAVTAT